jgi:hypothetical protein
MLAYHNDPAIKAKYLKRVRAHRKADRLVQGVGAVGVGKEFRSCAVGCTLEVYDHGRYPIELGIPEVLARLEDRIFEGMKPADAMKWPTAFLSAIKPGADLSMVWPRFALWMLDVELRKYTTSAPVAALYRRWVAGDKPSVKEWRQARSAYAADYTAYAAAAAAAYAAAYAYAAYAADAAAHAVAYAAADAAAAAYDSYAAYAAAKLAFWERSAAQLIKLLKDA